MIRHIAADYFAPVKKVPAEWLEAESRFYDWNRQDFVFGDYQISIGLAGQVQVRNAALAVAVLEFISEQFRIGMEILLEGLSKARWPARLQLLPDGTLLDGAHNPDGAAVLVEAVKRNCGNDKFTVMFGGLADKDFKTVVKNLAEIAERFVFVPVEASRPCCPVEQLIATAGEVSDVSAVGYGSLTDALADTANRKKIICGSLYLAGNVLKHYFPKTDIGNI